MRVNTRWKPSAIGDLAKKRFETSRKAGRFGSAEP